MAKRKRNELVFLEDIVECINKIAEYIDNVSEKEFKDNSEKQDAVIRRIEIIGEAAKNISENTRMQYSEIPWRAIAGMRDVVIHQYFGVTVGLVWRVATTDLPSLKPDIVKIIAKKNKKPD